MFICGLLSSCLVDGNEEVWLREDGSATVNVDYTFPAVGVEDGRVLSIPVRLESLLGKVDGVHLKRNEALKQWGKWHIAVEMEVDSARALLQLYQIAEQLQQSKLEDDVMLAIVLGKVVGKISDDGTFSFQRSVDILGLLPPAVVERSSLLGDSAFRYTIHLPLPLKSLKGKVSTDSKSVSWQFRLQDILASGIHQEFSVDLPMAIGREEITIEEDGSGEIILSYSIPQASVSYERLKKVKSELEELLTRHSGVRAETYTLRPKSIYTVVDAMVKFDSVFALRRLLEQESYVRPSAQGGSTLGDMMGALTIQQSGLRVRWNRDILLPAVIGVESFGNPELLQNVKFEYILNLPYACDSSNAHRVSDDGRKLEWSYKMSDVREMKQEVALTVQLPWWLWAVSILSIVMTGWLSVKGIKKLWQRNTKA